jgi:dipeptide/tripeptide permease
MSTSPRIVHPSGDAPSTGSDKTMYYSTSMPLEVELPANVSTEEQLESLPDECLTGDPVHPLLFTDSRGDNYKYHLNPMTYSVIYILIVELLERFAFYGINYTQAAYLTGAYNRNWNANMEAVQASSYVSVSTAIAYTMPFVGALLADCFLGEYYTIAGGAMLFYIPGLTLIALTTIPGCLGPTFNQSALRWGLLALWPIGTGSVKSVVNVFGAKQFHPILQSSLIESYYVNFYMCINIGALAGGVIVPQVAQYDITTAYFIPVLVLTLGVFLFLLGTPKYVRTRPQGQFQLWTPKAEKKKSPYEFLTPSPSTDFSLMTVLKISLLVIPFNIAYSQMATTFIVQGIVMEKLFGCIDAATMNNADSVAVLVFGYLIGNMLYPTLAKCNIKLATTHKFAIGSALGALAIAWALLVEYKIHSRFAESGEKVNVAWQAMSYVLIGAGEIFAVSAAYEVAFTASPPEAKALASATNLFCIGGLPNIACIILYQICAAWFHNASGTSSLSHLHEYAESKVYKYFFLLFLVSCFGVFVNLLPSVRDWVATIEEEAAAAMKTPMPTPMTPRRPIRNKGGAVDSEEDDEEKTALLKAKKHENYLKYGSGPQLYKQGSFRAGILWEMAKNKQPPKTKPSKYIQYPQGLTMYKGGSSVPVVRNPSQEAQTTRGMEALEKALEGKNLDDPDLSNTTL